MHENEKVKQAIAKNKEQASKMECGHFGQKVADEAQEGHFRVPATDEPVRKYGVDPARQYNVT